MDGNASALSDAPSALSTLRKGAFAHMYTPDSTPNDEGISDKQAEKILATAPPEAIAATNRLVSSFTRSRRALLRTAVAVAGGTALVGVTALNAPTHAAIMREMQSPDSVKEILTVARTAEQLAVTFYTNGIEHHHDLGINGADLEYLKAAVVEEQIHLNFFKANGGDSLASTFSFPHGEKTFWDLETFIATQQQLEGVFDSAFLAAISEFAQLGLPRLAQIAGQIACVEAEHRVLGRIIGRLTPADNFAFEPVLIPTVGQAPGVVKSAGYLSPVKDNSYTYHAVDADYPGVIYTQP